MRLEKRKELKDNTWKLTMFSPTVLPSGMHSPPVRFPDGSSGFQRRPKNTPNVKSEFTFTIPSSAVMCIVVDDDDDRVLRGGSGSVISIVGL